VFALAHAFGLTGAGGCNSPVPGGGGGGGVDCSCCPALVVGVLKVPEAIGTLGGNCWRERERRGGEEPLLYLEQAAL